MIPMPRRKMNLQEVNSYLQQLARELQWEPSFQNSTAVQVDESERIEQCRLSEKEQTTEHAPKATVGYLVTGGRTKRMFYSGEALSVGEKRSGSVSVEPLTLLLLILADGEAVPAWRGKSGFCARLDGSKAVLIPDGNTLTLQECTFSQGITEIYALL